MAQQPFPPPTHFCIDVECVATGTTHGDRAVAHVALVDAYERVLLNIIVKPAAPVVSYLTPLTGLTADVVATRGVPLDAALALLRSVLPRDATLVGQNIGQDVAWLGLKERVDFGGLIDLTGLFRVWNPRFSSYSVWGQDHLASVLLGWPTSQHDAATDAVKSIRLFNLHTAMTADPGARAQAEAALLASSPEPSFAKRHPSFEGVCMGNRKTCTCGAPFFG